MSKTGASSSQVCAKFQLDISSSTVRNWFGKSNNCFVLDRGFRDSSSSMRSKGFVVKMPSFKGAKRNQLTCEESNNSRIVTKMRWVVEEIHGIIKQKWSYLRVEIKNQILVKIGTLYGKRLLSDRALELRSEILERMTGEIPITNAFDDNRVVSLSRIGWLSFGDQF